MLLLLAFLFPLAVYCLIIGLINRRSHPLMVPGTWDFVGVVGAVSGLVLAGGAFTLGSFSDRWRIYWLYGQSRFLLDIDDGGYHVMTGLFLAYLLIVVGVIALVLWRRRLTSVIYNIEPATLDELFPQVFEARGLSWTRTGNRIFLTPADPLVGEAETLAAAGLAPAGQVPPLAVQPRPTVRQASPAGAQGPLGVLDVDPSPHLRTVTLEWTLFSELAQRAVREEVEAELTRVLAETPTPFHPLGGWVLTAAACLLSLCFVLLVFLVLASLMLKSV